MSTFPRKGSSKLRKFRWSESGHYYFITTRILSENCDLTLTEHFSLLSDAIQWLEQEQRSHTLLCLVMPDHLHWVFQLKEGYSLSQIMKTFKGFTGRQMRKKLGSHGAVWQGHYYDRLIRDEDELKKIIEYVLNNPTPKGFVEKWEDWQFMCGELLWTK